MNRIKLITPVLRSALFLYTFLLLAHFGVTDTTIDSTNIGDFLEEGVLVIRDGEVVTLDDDTEEIGMGSLTIEEGGILTIASGTMVHLDSGEFRVEGTLEISSVLGTGIYSGDKWWDVEGTIAPTRSILHVDGGVIKILDGGTELYADTIDVKLGEAGGTIDIEDGVTFESGTITGNTTGDVLKIGEGTFRVGEVSMGGNFTVEAGTVKFLDLVGIGGTFTLTEGTVEFQKNAYIYGGFLVGKQGEEEVQTGTVQFRGTAYIAENLTLESGDVEFFDAAQIGGNLTLVSGTVDFFKTAAIGGTLEVQEGTVHFGGNATVGKLIGESGTAISGLQADGESRSNLSIAKGGKIEGIVHDVGDLVLGDGASTATFEFFDTGIIVGGQSFSQSHSAEKIVIAGKATLDLKDGASIQLLNPAESDAHTTYNDLTVLGKLRVSSAAVGIYKGDLKELDLEETYLTVVGGTVEIYQSPDDPEATALKADTLHTRVVGGGEIIVESGVTFESGKIVWGNSVDWLNQEWDHLTGADVVVSGGGTFRTAEVDLGTGYFVVQDSGTTVEFLNTVTAGTFRSAAGTYVIAHENAVFDRVEIAGNYEGQDSDLLFSKGGWITGNATGLNNLIVGGELLLAVQDYVQTISTETWGFAPNTATQIRTVAGTQSGLYREVIRIADSDDRETVLGILNANQTALYRPKWSNVAGSEFLDLRLDILSMHDYINGVWHKHGSNINNVGGLIEFLGEKYPAFRERLEGLTEDQLERTIRSAMAGELAGNAFRIAMQQPARSVFRHLDEVAPLRSPFTRRSTTRGQIREGFNVWFNPFGQAEHAKGEGDTFDGYEMTRYGFQLGSDIELYNRAVAGVFFGYTGPNVKSDLGKISANDYTTGLYLRMPTAWEVVANLMIGFGSQDYSFRNIFNNSEFRGGSFFASAELARPISFPICRLTPLIALDFQSATMDGFIVRDPVLGGVFVEPENLSQAALRVGLLGHYGRLRTRLQYMRQIAGDDVVYSRTALVGDLAAATQVRSTQWGKDWLNVGLGGELLQTRHWRIFADYNFDLGKQTTSHLGSLNTVLTW